MSEPETPSDMKRFRLSVALGALLLVGCGGGGSSDATATTVTAPSITTQPSSTSATVGTAWEFSVIASGSSPTYQWYKLSTDSTGSAISGATSSSYGKSSAATGDAGTYYVTVSNSAGTVTSDQVTLTVNSNTGGASVVVK